MKNKMLSLSPIAIAIMTSSLPLSAQVISADQTTAINSQAATPITINDNVSVDVSGSPAITLDDPSIIVNVGQTPNSGSSITSDQIAIDVQTTANGESTSDPQIINQGTINGATIGIRLDRNANSGGDGALINVDNTEGSSITGGSRALEIEADTIDVVNSGTITLSAPSAEATNGVVFISDQASNVDIINEGSGVIDSGEGTEAAAISLQLNNGGRRNDITNEEGGRIIGRGNAAASGSDAGDGIRFERERELSSGQNSEGQNLEDIGTLQATTEQFLSQGNVVNAGVISSEGTNGTVAGIRVVDNVAFAGTITNEATGVITGEQNGLYFGNADHREIDENGVVEATGTVSNSGTISSGSRALNIDGSNLQITNEENGRILGTGVQRNGTVYSDGTAQNFSVNNAGTIDAVVEGSGFAAEIGDDGNTFTFDNSGTIQGRGDVDAADGFRVGNPGNVGTATVDITNSGTINSESTVDTTAGLRFVNGISFDGTIDNSGTISGAQNGVYFGNPVLGEGADHSNGVLNNLAGGTISSGSRALNIDGEGLTVNNAGQILGTGTQRNGTVYSDGTAQNFTVNNTGTIDAVVEGSGFAAEIGEDGNTFTFDNSGTIQGRGDVDAADGFRVGNPGNVGTATVDITNSGTINSESTVGTTAGLRFVNGISFDGTIDNSGTISGAQNGVYFGNPVLGEGADHSNGVLNNLAGGTISSGSRALNIDGEGLTVNNAGQILGTGTQRNGTVYSDGTAQNFTVNNTGTIDAVVEGSGFAAEIGDDGNTFTFDNSGTIQGRGDVDAADGFRVGNPGNVGTATVDITNSGTINSESTVDTTAGLRFVNGISFDGTIDNSGTISGAQNGVYFGNPVLGEGADHSNGVLNNLAGGTISSGSRALNIDGEGLTVNNAGTILGTGNQRNGTVYSDGTAQNFVVNNTGTIDAGAGLEGSGFAAEIGDDGNAFTFDNSGTITGRGLVDNADGFRVGNAGNVGTATVDITNSGTITSESTTGTTAGLRFVNGISLDGEINNSGTISGAQNGVYFGNPVAGEGADHSNGVLNNLAGGTISSDSRALNIDGEGLTVNNAGTILGTGSQRNGTVYADGTANNFTFSNTATGLVDGGEGNNSSALSIQVGSVDGDVQNASINNAGTLQGRGTGVSSGVRLFTNTSGATFSGDIINSGDIFAEDSAGILVQSNVTVDGAITNTGNISSASGTAIDFSENATGITFNQDAGDIEGSILLGAGDDVINIAGGSVSGDITGQGTGAVNVDLGAGGTFVSNGVNNVLDYNILSGTVNQVGDFSTAGTTTTVSSGATLAFNSTINGSGDLVSDGTLSFGLDGRLIQDGDVTLNDGSTVEFVFGEALEEGEQVTLIDALSITDNGVDVVDNSVLLDLESSIDADGNFIVETIAADLVAEPVIGLDDNTQDFAIALGGAIAAASPLVIANQAEFQSASADDLTTLAPSLSGAATLGAFQLNDANLKLVRNQYASGNATATELKNGIWVHGLSGNSEQDNQNGITGFDADYDGFGIGYNIQLDNKIRLGVAYTSSDSETSNNLLASVDTDIDSNQIAFFGDYQSGAWFLGGSLAYSDLEYDFNRASTLSGVSSVNAETDGSIIDASVNLGYKLSGALKGFSPIAGISYSSLDIDSFNEVGGAQLSNVDYDDVDRFRSELGVLFNTNHKYGSWSIAPSLKLSWKHDFEDDATAFTADVGGVSFRQIGNELESDVINAGVGVNFSNDNNWNFRIDYQGEFASDEDSQFGSATMEYRF